jgi:hypothetical protein
MDSHPGFRWTLRIAACAGAIIVLSSAGRSIAAGVPPNPKDLTQGKWELNLAKSKFCAAPPRKSTREILDLGWGLIATHWTGTDAAGNPMDIRYVWRYDNEKYPAEIYKPASEAISWKLVSPSRVEFVHWSKDDKITSTYVREVSADGQSMTQTTKIAGKPCGDVQVFERQ